MAEPYVPNLATDAGTPPPINPGNINQTPLAINNPISQTTNPNAIGYNDPTHAFGYQAPAPVAPTNPSTDTTQIGQDQHYQSYLTNIENINKGIFTPDQQQILDSTKQLAEQVRQQQQTANQAFTQGNQVYNERMGLTQNAEQLAMANIKDATDQGLKKLNELDAKSAQALSSLQNAFRSDDLAEATRQWNTYQDYAKQKNDALVAQQKAVQDAADKLSKETYDRVTKPIEDIASNASKFGAPPGVLAKINGAQSVADAIQAAVGYTTDPTSPAGQYTNYVRSQKESGKTPMSAGDFLAAQKYADALATAKANNAYSYSNAYNAALAKAKVDEKFAGSDKTQQKLEKDYSTTLLKELSNRSGGLGLQDQKVNQAIHLKALVNQYSDGKGNYNIPTAQYYELAIGLANLLSPTGSVAESDRQEIASQTAAGKIKSAVQFITGTPQNGNTQAIIKNLVDSIDRQGTVAQQLRDQDVEFLHGLAPSDLEQSRRDALEKNLLPSYTNPQQNVEQAQTQMIGKINEFRGLSPQNETTYQQAKKIFPNATMDEIMHQLGIQAQ